MSVSVSASASSMSGTGRRRRLSSNRSDGTSGGSEVNLTTAIPTTQEAEAIFQTLTVAEMREKRKEYNNGVEAKRQELRMLVGKRYAGLIEVADGISEMKTSSEGVTSSISELQSICHQLKKRQTTKINAQESEAKAVSEGSKQFYSITAQIKLLVSLPSRLYEALAQKRFSRASILLLLGTHVHQGLRLDTTAPDATQVFPFFPVISRMWPSIARFRPLIASASRAQLTSSSLSADAAIDALTALVTLEGVTLRQVFADFLIARSEALNLVFASSATSSVKDQLTEGISILLLSLKLVYEVFSSSQPEGDFDPSSSLLSHLQSLTSSSSPELKSDIIGCCGATVGSALPASVIDFKPALRGKIAPLADDQIKERCEKWFDMSLSSLRSSLSSQLAYVTSVKGLSHIRDVTAEILAKPEISTNWKEVSTAVLGREVCVWKEAVRPLTLERLESLLKGRLRASVNALIDDLKTRAHRNDDDDVLDFMWSESSSDIPRVPFGDGVGPSPTDGAGKASSSFKDPPSSQLRMKTKGRTPNLQAICRRLDEHLESVLEDARHFGVLKDTGSTVDLGEDVSHISSSLTRFAYEAFQQFFAFFDEELDKTSEAVQLQKLNNDVDDNCKPTTLPSVLRLVFLGRVCEALTELSPHLFNTLVPSAVLQFEDGTADGVAGGAKNSAFLTASTKSSLSFRRSLMNSSSHRQSMTSSAIHSSSNHHQDQSLFLDVKEDFLKRFWSSWEAWRRFALDDALSALRKGLVGDDFSSLLSSNRLTPWETVEIKEDEIETDENGKEPTTAPPSSLSTSIRVPVQATAGLHGVLHRLCRRINDVGGYIVPKIVVETVAEEFLRESASEFSKAAGFGDAGAENVVAEADGKATTISFAVPMNQTLAIQLSFDAKFLQQLLSHRGTTDETKQKIESFVSALESFIDPFDLDLLNPHLQARVLRHVQRTNALFGLLTSSVRSTGNSSRGGGGGTLVVANEKASTLMLCGGSSTLGSRFPTIPLPTPGGGAAGGKDAATLRRQMGAAASDHGASAVGAAAARRKDDPKGDKSSSPMHKASTWSSGLSKLTAREGSNSPSDFFKSGAALYTSWFGGGGNNE